MYKYVYQINKIWFVVVNCAYCAKMHGTTYRYLCIKILVYDQLGQVEVHLDRERIGTPVESADTHWDDVRGSNTVASLSLGLGRRHERRSPFVSSLTFGVDCVRSPVSSLAE